MLQGDVSLKSASVTGNLVFLATLYSTIVCVAQDYDAEIFLIDVIQTLFCWPSLSQSIIISISMYFMRDVERVLGPRSFAYLLIANFCTFFPSFLLVICVYGFRSHFSLLYFIPYALFTFYFLRLPRSYLLGPICDKDILLALFAGLVILHFPASLLCALSGVMGFEIWSRNFLNVLHEQFT